MSVIQKTRAEFIFELQHIMEEHSIDVDLTIKALAKLYNISWVCTHEDEIALFTKGILTAGTNKINVKKLFKGLAQENKQLEIGFKTEPKGTEETLKLADNLETNFVPPDKITDEQIKIVADRHFHGDIGTAKYFIIFECLFPKKHMTLNRLWNLHFGITHTGTNKWDISGAVPSKFHKLYLQHDIGLFLTGVYLYVKDSIDLKKMMVFCGKPRNFLVNWNQWYEEAKLLIEDRKIENITPEVSL